MRSLYFKSILTILIFCISLNAKADGIFFVNFEGGVANVDWPSSGIDILNNNNNNSSNTLILTNTTFQNNNFPGNLGILAGYAFILSPSLTLGGIAGYHYVSNSSYTDTFTYQNTGTSGSPVIIHAMGQQSSLNIVDLLLEGNYITHTGTNFFIQPGVAIIINSFTPINTNTGQAVPPTSNPSLLNGSATNVSFRPEIGVGIGQMITKRTSVYLKYNFIISNDLGSFSITPGLTPNISMLNLGISVII